MRIWTLQHMQKQRTKQSKTWQINNSTLWNSNLFKEKGFKKILQYWIINTLDFEKEQYLVFSFSWTCFVYLKKKLLNTNLNIGFKCPICLKIYWNTIKVYQTHFQIIKINGFIQLSNLLLYNRIHTRSFCSYLKIIKNINLVQNNAMCLLFLKATHTF